MIKIIWFLKRADNLTLEQFHKRWIEKHVPASRTSYWIRAIRRKEFITEGKHRNMIIGCCHGL